MRRQRWSSILNFAAAAVIGLIALEIFFLTSEACLPAKSAADPLLGKKLIPGARMNDFGDGFHLGRVNAYGYFGPAYPAARSPALRVALVGDSYVAGGYVFDAHGLRGVLESELDARLDRRVEVLNFGRTAIDFRKAVLIYERLASEFKPDIVVLVLSANDLTRSDRALGPTFTLDAGSELVVDDDFLVSRQYRWARRIDLPQRFAVVNMALRMVQLHQAGRTPVRLLDKLAKPLGFGQTAPTSVERREQPDALFPLNGALVERLVGQPDAPWFVVANRTELPDHYSKMFAAAGIEQIDLRPPLEAMREEGLDPNYWPVSKTQGHWNHSACRRVAVHLARQLVPAARAVSSDSPR